MLEHHLAIPADRIFSWLKDEMTSGRQRVTFRATREFRADDDAAAGVEPSDEEAGIHSVSTAGTLEIMPLTTEEGWLLRIYVEDVVGPHVPEDHSVTGEPEGIELDDFYAAFIAPDSGTVFVSLRTESDAAKEKFESLLAEMTTDRTVA